MADINITSHGQKGGITAQSVVAGAPKSKAPKDSAWVRWGTIGGLISAVLAVLAFSFNRGG